MTPGATRRRWTLALLATAAVLSFSVWFTGSAAAPELGARWGLDPAQAGWLTSAVQLGFVCGTALAAALNLADLLPARAYFGAAAALAAAANAALLAAPGFRFALVTRFLAGLFLAGVYPPAMKMVATWFRSSRGLAVGVLVGALSLGKATPYMVRALASADLGRMVLSTSAAALLAGVLVALLYRDGPHAFPRRTFSWSLTLSVLAHRPTRLAIGGYLGHMWELYAMWTWIPAFLADSLRRRGFDPGTPVADWLAFGAIAAGALGCVWGGWSSDRIGREALVNRAMAASGACALAMGAFHGASPLAVTAVAWCWGFFVVADSAQFSTVVTEVSPPDRVGTALTLQTCLGFVLTLASIQIVPLAAERWGWRWAFPLLAGGPALGIEAMRRLARLRQERAF